MSQQLPILQLHVAEARELNPLIRMFRLRAPDRGVLPGYSAGAHIRVQVEMADGGHDWRHYSLINLATEMNATDAPLEYVIAVRKEADGRGGSRFMHDCVTQGELVTIELPKNDFPLHLGPGGTVLVAGGIGVTPLVSMAARRRAERLPVRMHYAGRTREQMALLPELESLLGGALHIHTDADHGGPLDIGAVLDECLPGDCLYVCGPRVMLDAVLSQTRARGWEHDRVHFELFTTPVVEEVGHAFELELAQSGQQFTVPADQSILDCLIEHGCDPIFDCKRGECGVCVTAVIEGEIDHRDYALSSEEKASGKLMQICVSRCRGSRLVLDL